jgi:Protein of unknown function (DUF3891)
MILHPDGGELVVITQSDHARFAAELMSLWRAAGLPDHPRRRELLFAVREHDNGWWEADAAPRVDPASGRPRDFLAASPEVRIEIWLRGTARFAAERPYAALLINHHALAVHRERREEAAFADFFAALDERYEELLEAAGAAAESVADDYRFLDLGDRLSLAVCNRWEEPVERLGVRGRCAAGVLHLGPFPLAGATTFRIPARRIPDRPYAGDADLAVELARARWGEIAVCVAPEP